MNKEDIIRMGHEAGLCEANGEDDNSIYIFLHLERFAKLIVGNINPKSFMSWQVGYEAGVLAEKEACANLCLETDPFYGVMFAEAIRARGKE